MSLSCLLSWAVYHVTVVLCGALALLLLCRRVMDEVVYAPHKAHVATSEVFFLFEAWPLAELPPLCCSCLCFHSIVAACDHCLPCCDMLCGVLCQVLGEVIQPGERLVVAEGGKGGRGVVAPSRIQKQTELKKEYERAQVCGGVGGGEGAGLQIRGFQVSLQWVHSLWQ